MYEKGMDKWVLANACTALLPAVGTVNYPPLAGVQGVDSCTKLMLHVDGSDQGTSFAD